MINNQFFFNSDYLKSLSDKFSDEFKNAKPFKHVFIDNFLPYDLAIRISKEFPNIDEIEWIQSNPGATKTTGDPNIEKLSCDDEEQFPSHIRNIMLQFNSNTFLKFLQDITGIKHLIPDPSFNQCGLYSTGRGGRLMVHADSNRYPIPHMFHQHINVILYVTKDWNTTWGGDLELWDKEKKNLEKRIYPLFNRLLIFDTGKHSYHGHPQPLKCPKDIRRNNLALYYYVHERQSSPEYSGFQEIEWVRTNSHDKFDSNYLFFLIKKRIRLLLPNKIKSWIYLRKDSETKKKNKINKINKKF